MPKASATGILAGQADLTGLPHVAFFSLISISSALAVLQRVSVASCPTAALPRGAWLCPSMPSAGDCLLGSFSLKEKQSSHTQLRSQDVHKTHADKRIFSLHFCNTSAALYFAIGLRSNLDSYGLPSRTINTEELTRYKLTPQATPSNPPIRKTPRFLFPV